MKILKSYYWIFCVIPFCSASSLGAAEWLYQKDVIYHKSQGHNIIALADSQMLQVQYTHIKWKTVDAWKRGRQLHLAYAPSTGAVLLDLKSKKYFPIISGLKEHPIDSLLGEKLTKADSEFEFIECYRYADALWDKELNRAYKEVLNDDEDRKLNAGERKIIVESQRKWIQYRDAQIRAFRGFYGPRRSGTIWQTIAAERIMELTKSQAQRLTRMKGF